MTRLPQPGGDAGNWGIILNEFLGQSHNDDGTLKPVGASSLAPGAVTANALADGAVTTSSIADGVVTEAKLDSALADKVNAMGPVTSVTMSGDVTGSNTSTIVVGVAGNTYSGTPTTGQLLVATTDTSVSWGDGSATTLVGDARGLSTANRVARVRGITITGRPAAGKVLKATSATAASWQADERNAENNVITVTNNYTARVGDVVFADCTSNNIQITLPAPANGAYLTIKKTDDTEFDLTVVGAGTAKIDDKASWTNSANQTSQHFISDGTDWFLVDVPKTSSPPPSTGVLARSAYEFLESFGTCAKLGDSVYAGDTAELKSSLAYVGSRYIRSSTTQDATTLSQMNAVLGTPLSDGVSRKVHAPLLGKIVQADPVSKIQTLVDGRLKWFVDNSVANDLVSMESFNERELDGSDWAIVLRRTQPVLYQSIKNHTNASIKNVKVCGPSLAGFMLKSTAPQITNDSTGKPLYQSFDYGSVHSYPGGRFPETDFPTKAKGEYFTYTGADPASTDTTDDRLKMYAKYVTQNQRPIIITETGYHDYIWPATATKKGHRSTPPKAGGIYMPRLMLENFRIGIARTHIYELYDEPAKHEQEAHIGSFTTSGSGPDYNHTPKTWAKSLRNLSTILSDTTDVPSPGRLPFTWDAGSANSEFDPMLFQKSDGSFWIAVWRRISVCDYNQPSHNSVDITPSPWTKDITFTFDDSMTLPSSVTKYVVNYDSENTAGTAVSLSGRSFKLSVSPLVQLIKIVL